MSFSQERLSNHLFSKSFEVVNEKGKKGTFKGQILKGKRNGMGFLMQKDGYVYAGDFYRNDITGYGMLIATNYNYIEYCDSCTVYIGNWRDGVKSGFGTCYSANGDIIYQGQFDKDKPVNEYPTSNPNKQKHFACIEFENKDIFLGEINNDNINGYGVIIFNNGDLWLSNFKNGEKNGVGLYLLYNGEWEILNFSKNNYNIISSSANYRNIDEQRKKIFKSSLLEAMGYFSETAQKIGEIKGSIQITKHRAPVYVDDDTGNSEKISSNSSLQSQYVQWERRAIANYNSLTNLGTRVTKNGEDVGGTNGKSTSGGNYVMQKKALRQAQNEMKKIRTKAIQQGIRIQQSKYETIEVAY